MNSFLSTLFLASLVVGPLAPRQVNAQSACQKAVSSVKSDIMCPAAVYFASLGPVELTRNRVEKVCAAKCLEYASNLNKTAVSACTPEELSSSSVMEYVETIQYTCLKDGDEFCNVRLAQKHDTITPNHTHYVATCDNCLHKLASIVNVRNSVLGAETVNATTKQTVREYVTIASNKCNGIEGSGYGSASQRVQAVDVVPIFLMVAVQFFFMI